MKLFDGMTVVGYVVRSLHPVEGKPLLYGTFQDRSSAKRWQAQMVVETIIEPVYEPAHNRG